MITIMPHHSELALQCDQIDRTVSAGRFDRDLIKRVATVRSFLRGRIVFMTSFGLEDQTLVHAIFVQGLEIEVVTLDTGLLFTETYELWAETERRYHHRISALYADRTDLEALVAHQGIYGFYTSPEARRACCAVRKVGPLQRALAGAVAWIAGLRSDQSDHRADISFAAVDSRYRLIKINPLFDWTRGQVLSFIREHSIPYNSLHDKGFVSIGCAPCTRAIKPGEPERAGRWWWEHKQEKECGLHSACGGQLSAPAQIEILSKGTSA
jgi:phosphoadenosine phosphosulfate reductase